MGEMEWQRGHGVDTTEEPLPARTAAACPLAAELARPPPTPLRGAPSPAPATPGWSIMKLRQKSNRHSRRARAATTDTILLHFDTAASLDLYV